MAIAVLTNAIPLKHQPVCVEQLLLGRPDKSVGDVGGVGIEADNDTARVYTCCLSENGSRVVETRVSAIEQKTVCGA